MQETETIEFKKSLAELGDGLNSMAAILNKAPNVRFTQVAGIFITEFPRPLAVENTETGQVAGVESAMARQILSFVSQAPLSKAEIARHLGKSKPTRYLNELVASLLRCGLIEYTLPGKPNSRLQKYSLTPKGLSFIHSPT